MTASRDPSGSLLALLRPLPRPTDNVQAQIYREQQSLIVRNLLVMGGINIVNGGLVAIAAYQYMAPTIVTLWFTPIFLIGLLQIFAWFRFRSRPDPEHVNGSLLRNGETSSLFAGAVWGSASFILHSPDAAASATFLYLIQGGMVAGLVSIITPIPRMTARFLFACLLPVTLAGLMRGGEFSLAVTIISLVYLGVLIRGSMNAYDQLKSIVAASQESRTARENLVDALESTNDAFAFFDEHDKLMMANAKHRKWFRPEKDVMSGGEDGMPVLMPDGRWLMRSTRKTRKGGTVVMHNDVTMLKVRERELIEAQREAVEADAAKSRFLSTMSHELRTPMNVIIGFSKLMTPESKLKLSADEIGEYASNIHMSGRQLLRLINDIIDYSKVGFDKFEIAPQRVDVRSLLSESVKLAAGFEQQEDMAKFDLTVSKSLGDIYVDEGACKRVLINLISNAIRFGGQEERIVIRAGLDASGRPFVAVRDFGPGIPREQLDRVFEAFFQGDNSATREHSGAGLGLTICRHLAQLHEGDITIKSRLGVGTTATFWLPETRHIPERTASNEDLELPDGDTLVA